MDISFMGTVQFIHWTVADSNSRLIFARWRKFLPSIRSYRQLGELNSLACCLSMVQLPNSCSLMFFMMTYSVVLKEPLAVVVITLCLDRIGMVPNGRALLLISVVVDPLSSSVSSGLALRGMPCMNCMLVSRIGAMLLLFDVG